MKYLGAFEFWNVKLESDKSKQLYRFNIDTLVWTNNQTGEWTPVTFSDYNELNLLREKELKSFLNKRKLNYN